MDKNRIVGYCRVSTLEQKKRGYGIDIQVRDIKRCAEVFGLIVEDFTLTKPKAVFRKTGGH